MRRGGHVVCLLWFVERGAVARLDERAKRCAAASVRARREREASMARSVALKRSGKASDAARRRLLAANRAGEDGGRAGAREESRAIAPNALDNAKRGLIRRRQPNGRRESRRFRQDCDPTAYSCMPSGRKDAEIDQLAPCKGGCGESSRTLTRQGRQGRYAEAGVLV